MPSGGSTERAATARRIGKPVEPPELEEAVPLGAAILGGIGVGLYRDEQDAFDRTYKAGRIFEPDPEMTERYREGYEIFKELYPALRNVHAHLHEQGLRTQEDLP